MRLRGVIFDVSEIIVIYNAVGFVWLCDQLVVYIFSCLLLEMNVGKLKLEFIS